MSNTGIGQLSDKTTTVATSRHRTDRSVSWWGDVWRRFRKQRVPFAAAIVLLVLGLLAILAPVIAPHDPAHQFRREGLSAMGQPLAPSSNFWFGTDNLGRDQLSRLLYGGRISLAIGVGSTTAAILIALLVGGTAGFLGGKIDFFVMRFVDLVISVPQFFIMLLLVVTLERGVWVVGFVIAVFGWTYPARVFRGQILSLKEGDFILAARATGVPNHRVLFRHLLPHLLPMMTVYIALSVPGAIFAEASLSFLGLGVPPPRPSWGSMIQDGMTYYRSAPWLIFFPGFSITLAVISFNLVATGLREAMDPLRKGR